MQLIDPDWLLEKPAIYMIYCRENGKRYIGSAIKPLRRYKEHLKLLKKGTHHSCHLQRSYNKHNKDSFVFKVLYQTTKEDLIDAEQWMMDLFDIHDDELGFNICKVAGNTVGRHTSDETRQKISNWHKGKKLTEEHKASIGNGLRNSVKHKESQINRKPPVYTNESREKLARMGTMNCKAKLTNKDIVKIRVLLDGSLKQSEIAKMFNVTQTTVSRIKLGKGWKHV